MDLYDPRDAEVMTLVGQIDHLGVVVLCALSRMFPEAVKVARLARITKISDRNKTLQPILEACWSCGYASPTGSAPNESWRITDVGRSVLYQLIASSAASTAGFPSPAQPALPFNADPAEPADVLDEARRYSLPERFSPKEEEEDILKASSSSKRSPGENLSESEDGPAHAAQQGAVLRWLEAQHINGPKRAAVIDDLQISAWITDERLQAWLDNCQKKQAQGFKFRSSAVVYAVTCCLNHTPLPAPEAKPDPFVTPRVERHDPKCRLCGGMGYYSLNVPRTDPRFGKMFVCEGEIS